MPGRHQAEPMPSRRRRLRWVAGIAGGSVIAAAVLATTAASAGATSEPVKATFGVTGVATSNCPVSTGGTDVYVAPGQELDVKSSLAGIYVQGYGLLSDLLGSIASLDGSLVIDGGTSNAIKLDISGTVQKVTGLSNGDHHWKWTVSSVKLGGLLSIPLSLTSAAASAGGQLTWNGTIHVTSNAANCGVAVALPQVSASASVTGLPPIAVGVPGVTVSVPVNVPTGLPTSLPTGGGTKTGSNGGSGQTTHTSNPIPVPARVVPGPNGSGLLGSGNGIVGNLPGTVGSLDGGAVAPAAPADSTSAPAVVADQQSTGKHKNVDLAASRPASTGEVWVVLAIVAVIALAFVAATYARLYLMRHDPE